MKSCLFVVLLFCFLKERTAPEVPQGTFIRDISNVPRDSAREVDREWARNSASVPYSREDDVLLTDRHGDSIADMFKRDTQSSEVNECQCGVQCSCPSSCSCRQKKSLLPSSRVQAPVYLENNAAGKIEPQFHSLAGEDNAQIDENCPPAQFTTPCCSTSCCRSTCASKLPPCCDSKLNPESNPKLKAEPNPNLNPEPNIVLSNVDSMDKTGTLTADPDSNLNAEPNSNLNDEANPNLDPELNPILNLEPNLLMSNVDSIDKSGTLAETAEPNSNLNAEPNSKLNAKPNPNSNLNAEPNSNLNAEPNSNLNAEPNSNSNLNAEPNPNSMVSNTEHKSNLNPKNNPNLLQSKMDSIDTSGALTASVETNSNQMESIADSNDVGSLRADNLGQVASDNTGSISADTIGDQSDNMASISADDIAGQSDNVASLSADTQESDISNMASLSADGNIGVSSDNTASLTLDAGNVGSIRDTIDALSVKKDTVPTYNDEVFRNPGSSDKTDADKLSQASNDQIDQEIAGNQANMRQAYGNNVNAAGMKNDADPAKTNVYTLNDVNIDSTNARDAADAIDSPDATSADARNSQSANSRDVKDVAFGNSLDVRNTDAANSLDRNVDENLMDSSISQSSNSPDVKNVESANTIDASVDSARTFDSNNVESSNTLDASNTGVTNSLNGRNADSANALGDTNSVNILDSRPDSDNSLEGTNFESAQKLVIRTVDNTEERDNMASVGAKHPATFRIVNPREYEITRSKINALNNDYNEEIRSKRDLLDTMETIQPLEDTRQADCYL
ncbi:hypothetical protein M8J75_015892 [Diaphorina citri]|nr:hypothetical protein M8J75_015892 [Diaphorina citri]